ncbi:TPA: hypothetical protein ACGA4J_001358 [Acinetobacter baumannii]
MDNYKIKVKDESSADEARDLFKKLGYHPDNSSYEPYVEWVAVFEDGSGSFYSHNMNLNECVEITIDQLQELVVLNRNDVNDANHRDDDGKALFITNDNVMYYWGGEGWLKSAYNGTNAYESYLKNRVKPINEPNMPNEEKDPALISGADAKLAWANGQEVEYQNKLDSDAWLLIDDTNTLGVFSKNQFVFRLKPQTIKLELELPKPFEPKPGDMYWFISPFYSTGYDSSIFEDHQADKLQVQYGAYRTQEEIKKVVEQLRKIRGTNS